MRTITALTIDGLTFDGTNYILQEVKGFEMPTTRVPRYNLPGISGAYVSNILYGERAITITGVVNAPDNMRTTYLANRTTLINALTYKRDVLNNFTPQTMTITLENGQIFSTSVYVDKPLQMGFSMDQVEFETFQISLIAPDPNIYSTTSYTSTLNLPVGGGTAIPAPIPMSLAASSGGSAVINNVGSLAAYPIITLASPLVNPYIVNNTTGQFLKITYTLGTGDNSVIIDCAQQTITQGANTLYGIQSQDSTFWELLAGNNTIGFSAAGGSGTAQIVYSPTYIGI